MGPAHSGGSGPPLVASGGDFADECGLLAGPCTASGTINWQVELGAHGAREASDRSSVLVFINLDFKIIHYHTEWHSS